MAARIWLFRSLGRQVAFEDGQLAFFLLGHLDPAAGPELLDRVAPLLDLAAHHGVEFGVVEIVEKLDLFVFDGGQAASAGCPGALVLGLHGRFDVFLQAFLGIAHSAVAL